MVLDAGAVQVAQLRYLIGLRLLVERHVQRRHPQLICGQQHTSQSAAQEKSLKMHDEKSPCTIRYSSDSCVCPNANPTCDGHQHLRQRAAHGRRCCGGRQQDAGACRRRERYAGLRSGMQLVIKLVNCRLAASAKA